MPPKIRCSAVQKRMLVEYMSQHRNFANGEYNGPLGATQYEAQWEALARHLREYGPDKTVPAWKVTWRDLRRNARVKNAEANRSWAVTGNNTEIPIVSEEDQLVLATIGRESSEGVGPEESRIGDFNSILDLPDSPSLDFLGTSNSIYSSTFSEGNSESQDTVRPSQPTPITATITAPIPNQQLPPSTTQPLFSISNVLSTGLPIPRPEPALPPHHPRPARLIQVQARPAPYARPQVPSSFYVNPSRPSLHELAAIIPRAQNPAQAARPTRNRMTEPASSTANFASLQEEQNHILRGILQALKRSNEIQQKKLELLQEQNLLPNRNGILEDTAIIEDDQSET